MVPPAGFDLLWLHLTIAAAYLVTALVVIWEALITMTRRRAVRTGELPGLRAWLARVLGVSGGRLSAGDLPPAPSACLIVAAFLPNEREIIVETVRHVLATVTRPDAGFEVILAYNTPCHLPVEDELQQLADADPAFKLLRVAGSESKAENVNAALEIAAGEITCILDADHHPCEDCLTRAWRWIANGYDVVQGRSVVRNH